MSPAKDFFQPETARCAVESNVWIWPIGGARFRDLVTRKLTVALYQPMPGLEEPDRKRLLPVWVC
jgi:hypothetical protein